MLLDSNSVYFGEWLSGQENEVTGAASPQEAPPHWSCPYWTIIWNLWKPVSALDQRTSVLSSTPPLPHSSPLILLPGEL